MEAPNASWWKQACDSATEAIAFVDTEDRFAYVNKQWSVLTGYAASQLVGLKTWKDITVPDDIGADQIETEKVQEGDSDEYYVEKKYLRADGTKVRVGIYVHRHPPFGPHAGYVVFAKRLGSKEFEDLRHRYSELQQSLTVLQQTQKGFSEMKTRMGAMEATQATTLRMLEQLIGKPDASSMTVGDVTGRDKNSTNLVIALALVVVTLGALVFGGKLYIDMQNQSGGVESRQE